MVLKLVNIIYNSYEIHFYYFVSKRIFLITTELFIKPIFLHNIQNCINLLLNALSTWTFVFNMYFYVLIG